MEVSDQFHGLAPRERAPGTHLTGGWVNLRAGMDAVSKRKISSPRRESKPEHSVAIPIELSRLKSLQRVCK